MNDRDTIKKLAERIKKNTESKTLSWNPSSRNNSFETKLGDGSVIISFNRDPFSISSYELSLFNKSGVNIGSILAFGNIDTSGEKDSDYRLLEEIYTLAEHSSKKFDETLQSMFNDLDIREGSIF